MWISVLTPALNEEGQIRAAVASAWAAGGDGAQITQVIVADGGSTDQTVAEAERAGATVLTGVRGRGQQLRLAAEHATSEVLLILHADNRLPAGAAIQIRQSLANKRVGYGAFRQRIDAAGWRYRLLERGNAFRARRLQLPYGDQGVFVRREVLDAAGGVPALPLMEDVALMQALGRTRKQLGLERGVLLPGPLAVSARRWRRAGVLRQTLRNWALLSAFVAGVPAARLVRWYAPHSVDG